MDPNRRSGVSSYYGDAGARRPSHDALAAGHQPQPSTSSLRYGDASSPTAPGFDGSVRRDSSATLFNTQPRAGTPGGGGYNQASYSHVGRAEPVKGGWDEDEEAGLTQKDEGWDVYADFNNAGPKYSSAYGSQHAWVFYDSLSPTQSCSYLAFDTDTNPWGRPARKARATRQH
jgi:hypothetical protein